MFKKINIILMSAIPFIDIFIEYIYQTGLYFSIVSRLEQYPNFSKNVLGHHTLKYIKESIHHTLIHISTNVLLTGMCVFLVSLTINHKIRTSLFNFLFPIFYLFPSFSGVSSFEIFLLEVQCAIIRIFESKWICSLFFEDNILLNISWPLFVFFILVPLEIRFKIYIEKRLHYKAPIFIGILHAISSILLPIVYLLVSRSIFKCSLIESISFPGDLKKISVYHLKSNSHHLEIIPISYYNSIIIKGNISHHKEDILSSLIFESSKFDIAGIVSSLLMPFIKNLIFAFFVVYFDKKYLKMFCSNDIHHICAHLIVEEFLNIGFFKYLLSPLIILENLLVYSHDDKIRNFLLQNTEKSKIATEYFNLKLHSHKSIHPSFFYCMFNNETNTISRLNEIL